MDKDSVIYIAGHNGLVGSAISRNLNSNGYLNWFGYSRDDIDLTDSAKVDLMFMLTKPEYVFLCAAMVGGIVANSTRSAEFIYNNIKIQTNIINSCYKFGVKKLLFLGSSCIYPKYSPQPMREDALLSGLLEPTNKAYAIAKISGIVMCESYNKQYGTNFISVMPTNSYGINDTYNTEKSHVIPVLIKKIYDAKQNNLKSVTLLGSGRAEREFVFSDDLAEACIFVMNSQITEMLNIGSGETVTISDLANKIKYIVGYDGDVLFDNSSPDGPLLKSIDSSKINCFGWKAKTTLDTGLPIAFNDFLERIKSGNLH